MLACVAALRDREKGSERIGKNRKGSEGIGRGSEESERGLERGRGGVYVGPAMIPCDFAYERSQNER